MSEMVALVDKAHRSLQFYNRQLCSLAEREEDDETHCFCLGSARDLETMAILPCSHVFHSECIRAALANHPSCPYCHAFVVESQMSSVVVELKAPVPAANMSVALKHAAALHAKGGPKTTEGWLLDDLHCCLGP